jgi:hypothetical protein
LRDLGYVEEQNLIRERRSAEGHFDRFTAIAAEPICLNVGRDRDRTRGVERQGGDRDRPDRDGDQRRRSRSG